MRILAEVQCKQCAGFGWINRDYGHRSERRRELDEGCTGCGGGGVGDGLRRGSGYRKGASVTDLIRVVRD